MFGGSCCRVLRFVHGFTHFFLLSTVLTNYFFGKPAPRFLAYYQHSLLLPAGCSLLLAELGVLVVLGLVVLYNHTLMLVAALVVLVLVDSSTTLFSDSDVSLVRAVSICILVSGMLLTI